VAVSKHAKVVDLL